MSPESTVFILLNLVLLTPNQTSLLVRAKAEDETLLVSIFQYRIEQNFLGDLCNHYTVTSDRSECTESNPSPTLIYLSFAERLKKFWKVGLMENLIILRRSVTASYFITYSSCTSLTSLPGSKVPDLRLPLWFAPQKCEWTCSHCESNIRPATWTIT
jgi:hypothetical protein